MVYSIGIDIGSTSSKTLVLDNQGHVFEHFLQPTGWSSLATAKLIEEKLGQLGLDCQQSQVVATGYGRISVPYAKQTLTEITCHARGAGAIYKASELTVIDIGGQDTKVITLEGGKVSDFIMNDKCSAGTGRFLEVMSNTLALEPESLCQLAAKGSGVSISSMCTVFAESEVISLIGRGESRENIAFGVVDSIVKKVASQCQRVTIAPRLALSGGLCGCEYLRGALSKALNKPVEASPQGRFAGALGAALYAQELAD